MNLNELKSKIYQADAIISRILKDSGYQEYECASSIEYDTYDHEENFLLAELEKTLPYLDKAHSILNRLQQPIIHQGVLHLNPQSGRYECDGIVLTCGSSLEVLDLYGDHSSWIASRIEADNQGNYYLVAKPNMHLEGVKARIRKSEW